MPESENNNTLSNSKEDILGELNHILTSDLFSRSSVLSNFLKFIVEETLANRTEELKEYTIAVHALGKSPDFDSQIDAIVRIHAGRLRRLLNEYYSGPGQSDLIKIEVVKGTYVPVFRTHLNKNLDKTETDNEEPIKYSRSKLTLVVLPFRNLCAENEYQFFVDGFGEELTNILSTFQIIDMVAHHSARRYSSNVDDVRVIGAALGVHYIISGSVKRTSEDIRINIGLVETLNGMQIWSQSYNHTLNINNLIDIQDQIVKNVCSTLGGYYGVIIRIATKTNGPMAPNLVAFDAALWNYYFHMNFSQETYWETRKALEGALRQDSNYATGLAMLAELYLHAYSLGYPTVEDPVNKAYQLAKKAIIIDPRCQHAHQVYGWANVYMKRKVEAVKHMELSLTLNPSSVSSMGAVGFGMACAGEYKRAHELLTKSIDLNPHCPWWFYMGFFLVYYNDNQYKKALEYANKIEVSDVFLQPLAKAATKAQLGLHLEATADVEALTKNFPEIRANLKTYLNTFLLDNSIVDKIIQGIKKADPSYHLIMLLLNSHLDYSFIL